MEIKNPKEEKGKKNKQRVETHLTTDSSDRQEEILKEEEEKKDRFIKIVSRL